MTIAILPARGGSKRIPGKNYREINGKPTICRTIQVLQKSQIFARIVVSTDHPKISELALSVGAEVPFQRPDDLSDDYTTTKQVMQHAIQELKVSDTGTAVCCVYPTAVLLEPGSLRQSFQLLKKNPSMFIVPVQHFSHPISRAMRIRDNTLEPLDTGMAVARTQDCADFVHDAGQFYWGTVSSWQSDLNILGTSAIPFSIPTTEGLDVDTPDDWTLLDALIRYREANDDKAG
ncbi:MAG: pseudaminic acid cytidylyltransferase [Gammaproteobacteria bacterium]|nr:pseudaminic acid cytidylyltransferase [Gammaproteobacteria bacterium]